MSYPAVTNATASPTTLIESEPKGRARYDEMRRMARHPISRWYLSGLVVRTSTLLAPTAVRPWQVTLIGAAFSCVGALTLVVLPTAHVVVALLVWAAWLCDRLDGALARRQVSATAWGAWLDANIDEAADVIMHTAVAVAAVALWPAYTLWIWALLVTFVAAKYLLMHGLWTETGVDGKHLTRHSPHNPETATSGGTMRRLYHLPGNADVRVHLVILALVTGWLPAELALVAGYYAVRVVVRYPLVISRLQGGAQ